MVFNVEINFFEAILFTLGIDEAIYKDSSPKFWRACLSGEESLHLEHFPRVIERFSAMEIDAASGNDSLDETNLATLGGIL